MKLSETLYAGACDLWREAADKPFVKAMATGTLGESLFRNYMIQDYLYLLEYIEILRQIRELAKEAALRDFIQNVISETENETYRVHLPQMKKIGVSDKEITEAVKSPVIAEYTGYMRGQLQAHGLLAGLTALLQCSWLYAYIGENLHSQYAREIQKSPYQSWFAAYTCTEYISTNQKWIDVLDSEAEGINSETISLLTHIFRTCAGYENKLWDELWN